MTADQARSVYALLVRHAGAFADDRDGFVHHMTHGCTEWRFQGRLGFGGKLHVEPGRWRVGCYPKDLTPERRAIIDLTNAKLADLHAKAA